MMKPACASEGDWHMACQNLLDDNRPSRAIAIWVLLMLSDMDTSFPFSFWNINMCVLIPWTLVLDQHLVASLCIYYELADIKDLLSICLFSVKLLKI
jgi:hypothetical protein